MPELTETLTSRLSTAVKNPNVSVMVKEIRSFRVHFIGRVAKPGVYRITAGMPLLQALTLAGGPIEGADLPAAYIIRADRTIPVDLRKLIQEGDLSKNIKVEREDTIVIPEISIGSNLQDVLDRRVDRRAARESRPRAIGGDARQDQHGRVRHVIGEVERGVDHFPIRIAGRRRRRRNSPSRRAFPRTEPRQPRR